MMERVAAGFIVEGACEFEAMHSFNRKIRSELGYLPISNAKGNGNILKNTSRELLLLIKPHQPRKVIITLDYRDALKQGLVSDCIELKEKMQSNCLQFIEDQKNGSLLLPDEIVVVIVDKAYETWICADYEALKMNSLFDASKITESFTNVDAEIHNPHDWLQSKLVHPIDMKIKRNRKAIVQTLRPEIAKNHSRSFRKFYDELNKIVIE